MHSTAVVVFWLRLTGGPTSFIKQQTTQANWASYSTRVRGTENE